MTAPNPATPAVPATATDNLHHLLLLPIGRMNLPDAKAMRQLLDAGADVNGPDKDGVTPLLRCLMWRYHDDDLSTNFKQASQDGLDLLLQYGADMTAQTANGETAVMLAKRWRDANIAQKKLEREAYRRSQPELMAHVSRIHTAWPQPGAIAGQGTRLRFLRACIDGEAEEAAYLAHLFPDAVNWGFDNKDHKGATALMEAIRLGSDHAALATTALFIRKQADLNVQSASGQSALHLAAARHADCISLLIAAGANEKLVNLRGYTAHDIAHHEAMNTTQKFLDALLEAIELRDNGTAPVADTNDNMSISAVAQERLGTLQASKKRSGVKFKL